MLSLGIWRGSTAIGDAGVVHLLALPNLEVLDASATRITDAGLQRLGAKDSIRQLFVSDTEVTDTAVRNLKQARPQVFISK